MTFLVMVEQIMSEDLEPPGDSDGAAAAEASPEAKKLKLESAQPKLVDRKWLNTSAKKDQQDSLANRNGSFKIMQFNTLADGE